ncbi:MAG: protealysin inhibitor emfourin, partial [Terriglobia bacterium]
LVRLIQAARFFDLPAIANVPSPGAADYRIYTITVEDKGRHHTVSFADPVNNRSLLALRNCLQAKVRKSRRSR